MKNSITYLKKFSNAFIAVYYAELVSLFSLTAISIILGKMLDAEALGFYSICLITATLFRMFAESGYELEILREISTDKEKIYPILIEAQDLKNTLITVTLPLMLLYFYFSVSDLSCLLMIPYNYFASVTHSYKAVLRAIKSYKVISKVETIYAVLLLFFSIITIYFTKSVALILLIFVIMELVKNLLYIFEIKKDRNLQIPTYKLMIQIPLKFNKWKIQVEKIKNRLSFMIINTNSVLQNRAGFFMLGIVGTDAQAGIFSAAFRFINFLRSIPWSIISVLLPEYAIKLKNSENVDLRFGLMVSFIIGFFISAILWYLADFLIEITYDFNEAGDLLEIISFSFVAIMLNTVCETYLIALRKEKSVNISMFISILFSLISSLILYNYYGNYGVAYTFLLSEYLLLFSYIIFIFIYSKRPNHN